MNKIEDIEEDIRKLLSYSEEELREGLNIHQYKNRNQSIPLSKDNYIKLQKLRDFANEFSKKCVEGQKKWRGKYYPKRPKRQG